MLRNTQGNNKPKRMPRNLKKAIENSNDAVATQLLSDPKYQQAEWINSVTREGKTPLLLALECGRYNIARQIMRKTHTDMNATYDRYLNAYELCTDLDFGLELLLDTRTNTPPYNFICSALLASEDKDDDFQVRMMQAMIAKGMNVNDTYGGDATPLHWAVWKDRIALARYLLSLPGIDVNKTCPLARVADYHNVFMLQLLLAHPEIDVSRKNFIEIAAKSSGMVNTPLAKENSIRVLLNHPEIAKKHLTNPLLKWLLQTNLDLYRQVINLPDTKISAVTTKSDWYENSKLKCLDVTPTLHGLLSTLTASPEFDVNMPLWNGHTLLTWVIDEHDIEHLQILLDCERVNLHRQNRFGHSALTLADSLGKQEVVETIMNHPRFNLHTTYAGNRNLLMHTAEYDCSRLMCRLLANGQYPINAADVEGNTALILLANNHKNTDDASLFLELMSRGADPEQKNNRGINAIMAAKNNGLKGIAHALKHDKHIVCADSSSPSAPAFDQSFIEAVETPPQPSQQGIFAQNREQHSNLPNEQLNACKYRGPQ